jgi:hypothetical protein
MVAIEKNKSNNREELVEQAKLAELAERYDDMTVCVKKVVELGRGLNFEERNLLSMAYKMALYARRNAYRAIAKKTVEEDTTVEQQQLAREYRDKVEAELRKICHEIIVSSQILK